MTLKEKLEQYIDPQIDVIHLEKIADDYAIEFAEWCDDNYFRMGTTNLWSDSMDWGDNIKITTKELLVIFKKEREL